MSRPTTTWKITLNSPWYEFVRDGKKLYEGRSAKNDVTKYAAGDLLEIRHHVNNTSPAYTKKIVSLTLFRDFRAALTSLGLGTVLPGVETIDEGVKVYYRYVSQTTQDTHGVCMIELAEVS